MIMKTMKIGDLTNKIGSGVTPRGGQKVYQSEGTSLIRSQNVYDYKFVINGLVYIDEDSATKMKGVEIYKNDVLMNITGDSIARCCIVPDDVIPARVNQHVCILRAEQSRLNPRYLMYYLNDPLNKNRLLNQAHGGTRKALTKGILESFEIDVPPLSVQERLVEILGSLDEKIELNRRMNDTLEQMAMALYKHWFGEGEDEQQLSDLIDINPKINIKKGTPTSFVDMKALPVDSMSVSDDHVIIKPFSSGSKFIKNDILFARITPCLENGKTAYVDFLEEGQPGFGSTEFLVFRAKGNCCPQYVYCLSRDPEFRAYAIKSMVGTSGRQRVQTSSISEYLVAKPDADLMRKFDETTKDWFSQIRGNTKEISELKKIRDFLLPRLLTGEIEVKVAEEQVEEVLVGG
ncbi:restriction endonuclease subunit S [Paenibacillus sp. FSL W7-1287]|uniref:restriction endonuclease subunit S n=1 Tax=Paenibacillus sp. FSL W7-1287 TaxID=2954538 RepID=UPI0030F63E5E